VRRPRVLLGPIVFATVACIALTLWAGTALGKQDDVRVRKLPTSFRKYLAKGERQYKAWLRHRRHDHGRLAVAPYGYLRTVSHKQRRNDWCGPATMAIIDHYLRGKKKHWSQRKWSSYRHDVNRNGRIEGVERLWTDAVGTYPAMMAVGLKRVTRRPYACFYFPSVSRKTWQCHLMNKVEYAIDRRKRPAALSARIDPRAWTRYRFTHAGHIMCARGFDWRKRDFPIYVDDPYPENAAPPLGRGRSGGRTYGKRTYYATKIATTMYYVVY